MSLNAQYAIASGQMDIPPKELAADQCSYTFVNSTIMHEVSDEYIFPLYKISYMWFTMVGAIFTLLVSLACSTLIFGFNDPKSVSPELITPMLRKRIFNNTKETSRNTANTKDTEF
jgi:hypothetical protein